MSLLRSPFKLGSFSFFINPNDLDAYEVLKAISAGLLNKEIATNLDISERTVKNHISNIFKKIDVADRTQAAVFAIKNNIVKI